MQKRLVFALLIHGAPLVPRNIAPGEGDALKGPGVAEPVAESRTESFIEALSQCACAHPAERLGVVAGLFTWIDVASTETNRLVWGHHCVTEGAAKAELALMPSEIDQVVL